MHAAHNTLQTEGPTRRCVVFVARVRGGDTGSVLLFSGTKQMDSADEDVCICMQPAGGTKEFLCEMDSAVSMRGEERACTHALVARGVFVFQRPGAAIYGMGRRV